MINIILVLLISVFHVHTAQAEYRLGGYLGVGGAGIKSVNTIATTDIDVQKSDGPVMFGLAWEYLTSDLTSISIDHTRGVFLSPFSSGVGFTGVTWRWFLGGGKAPSVVESSEDENLLLINRKIPFVGISAGIANGYITRENELISNVSAAGVYYGLHGGYDYQPVPGKILRVEALYAATPTSSGFVKKSLSEFSIHFGWYFIYQ